jgi:hypothetical protein
VDDLRERYVAAQRQANGEALAMATLPTNVVPLLEDTPIAVSTLRSLQVCYGRTIHAKQTWNHTIRFAG